MKDLGYYTKLPYTVIVRRDAEGDFVARIVELEGCVTHGKTVHEALDNLHEVQELWIAECLESGSSVPEPEHIEQLPSGKWVQRVPRSLHKKLVALAKREGVSLNQLVTSILSERVGGKNAYFELEKSVTKQVASALGEWRNSAIYFVEDTVRTCNVPVKTPYLWGNLTTGELEENEAFTLSDRLITPGKKQRGEDNLLS